MGKFKEEPSADIREIANIVRQIYVSFVEQGFNEKEALDLSAKWMVGMSQGSAGGGDGDGT